MKKSFLDNINWLVKNVKKNNFANLEENLPVGKFSPEVQKAIGAKTDLVYLKAKIFAKISGWINPPFIGHKEILKELWYFPLICFQPLAVYKDKVKKMRFW